MATESIARHQLTPERPWPPPQGQWAYEDYARLPDNGMRYEVIGGDLYMAPAPRTKHQRVTLNLASALHQFVRQRTLGEVLFAPIDLILPGLASSVQPDILYISNENSGIVKENYIEGIPDWVAEIIPPGNPMHDRFSR